MRVVQKALTFDDVVVVPGYSEVLPSDVDTSAVLARDIKLSIPVVSAAMDRVTESAMAIALARLGGIGVIHRNLDPDDQAADVRRVKRSQSGMITDPVTVGPHATVAEAETLMNRFPMAETLRQIAPGTARPKAVKNGLNEQPIVFRRTTYVPLTPRQKILDPIPLVVA